jgi:hypothetical protein
MGPADARPLQCRRAAPGRSVAAVHQATVVLVGAVYVVQYVREAIPGRPNDQLDPTSDRTLSVSQEIDARLQFEAGLAAFQVNYPFVYASLVTPPQFAPQVFDCVLAGAGVGGRGPRAPF